MSALIELESIARSFIVDDAELKILTDINLRVEAGQHVAIVGRSGTGKSTLLNIIGMLDTPSSGEYRFNGSSVNRLGEAARAKVRGRGFGFIFQSFNLINGLTTTENVYTPLLYASGPQFWTRNTRAKQLLEQQRVAIARALSRRPQVILADEPTGALDVHTAASVMDLLEKQCHESGAALIVITHDLAVAARAQMAYQLADGCLHPIDIRQGLA